MEPQKSSPVRVVGTVENIPEEIEGRVRAAIAAVFPGRSFYAGVKRRTHGSGMRREPFLLRIVVHPKPEGGSYCPPDMLVDETFATLADAHAAILPRIARAVQGIASVSKRVADRARASAADSLKKAAELDADAERFAALAKSLQGPDPAGEGAQ